MLVAGDPPERARARVHARVRKHAQACVRAGTSCVDYSTLNNEKKSLHDGGESSQTFFGMFAWVKKAKPRTHALTRTHVRTPTHTCARQVRPKIVILENVCGGPWEDMRRIFEEIGYSADYMRLDTKRYYIPQAPLNACF